MPQIFHRSTNTISKLSIFGALFILVALGWAMTVMARSSYMTTAGVAYTQPVQFSHQHHVGLLGIDCRYCHTSVETSSFAGIPPTKTCMNCHSQIWVGSPYLDPVRESYRTAKPISWQRVHYLPHFVYFDHSIHLNKGFGCVTCHGPVDQMELTWQHGTLLMEWCLDCHREPEKYVRPRNQVFNLSWKPSQDQLELGRELAQAYQLHRLLGCSTCHR
jgi:hypothetical protein